MSRALVKNVTPVLPGLFVDAQQIVDAAERVR